MSFGVYKSKERNYDCLLDLVPFFETVLLSESLIFNTVLFGISNQKRFRELIHSHRNLCAVKYP